VELRGRESWPIILPKCTTSTEHLVFFYMPQIYDMGPMALLPSEGRRAADFFALKNPMASAGLYIHTHLHQCCARFLWQQTYNRVFVFHEVSSLIQSARYNASHNRPVDCTPNTLPSSITFIKSKCLPWPSASFPQSVHHRWRQGCEEKALGAFVQWRLWNFIFNDKKERRWNTSIAGLKKIRLHNSNIYKCEVLMGRDIVSFCM
jgi:hypothetical protein